MYDPVYSKKYRLKHKKYICEYQKKYKKKHHYKSIEYMHKKRFGNMRGFILQRDKYKCVLCGMIDEIHISIWNRHLTINHIDHNGRYSNTQNNDTDNLETLCLRCHGAKDAIKHGKYSIYLANLYRERSVNKYGISNQRTGRKTKVTVSQS